MCVCEATGAKVATTVPGGCGVSVKTRVVYLAGRTLMIEVTCLVHLV